MTALCHRELVGVLLAASAPGYGTTDVVERSKRGSDRVSSPVPPAVSRGFSDETYLAWERDYKWRCPPAMACRDRRQGGVRSQARSPPTTARWRAPQCASKPDSRCCSPTRRWRSRTQSSGRPMERDDSRTVVTTGCGATAPNENASAMDRHGGVAPAETDPGAHVAGPHRLRVHRPSTRARLPQAGGDAACGACDGFDFAYSSTPNWETYSSFLELCRTVKRDLADLGPRDQIDIQSFLWVQGSDEY